MSIWIVLLVVVGMFNLSWLDSIQTTSCCGSVKKTLKVPDDYVKSDNIGYHKYYKIQVPWQEAFTICRKDGGSLAVICSIREAEILSDMMNQTFKNPFEKKHYRAWVGVHGFFGQREWTTVLGDPLNETGFHLWSWKWGGQPDDSHPSFKCVSLDYEIGLDDHDCDDRRPFFCKFPLCNSQ